MTGWLSRFGPAHIAAAFDVKLKNGVPVPGGEGLDRRGRHHAGRTAGANNRHAGLVPPPPPHALVTDVGRDGMLQGLNIPLYQDLVTSRKDIAWQASGGVATLDDIREGQAPEDGRG